MALIESPPLYSELINDAERMKTLFAKAITPEFQAVIKQTNDEYYHWDQFKQRPIPEDVTHEEVWAYVRLIREGNKRFLPFPAKDGTLCNYWIPDSVLRELNAIDLDSGGSIITDQPGHVTSTERYIISSLMEEAIASSQLEGAATTRKVAKQMLRTGRSPINQSEQMILNNWETIQYIRANRDKSLSPDMLLEIHRIITMKTVDASEAGKLRTRDDIVVEYNHETVHVPPAAQSLPQRISAFCAFANDDSEWIHPVIKAAIIHFWLAYDHPFNDGNGRTARAVMYWYLLSRKYSLFEYLSISRYFRQSPGQYVRAYLYSETDGNDLTYFLVYNLKAIGLALQDLRKYLLQKQGEIKRANDLLRSYKGLNQRQKTLVYHALQHPDEQYSIEAHKNYHAIVYQTARNDLLQLADKGFLRKEKLGKEFVFYACDGILDKLRKKEIKNPDVAELPNAVS